MSTSVDVIRGDGLKSVLGVRFEDRLPILDRRAVDRSCAGGKCAFIVGRVEPDGGSARLQVDLFRAGRSTADLQSFCRPFDPSRTALSEIHNIAIDLRRAAGEAPGAIALTTAPPLDRSPAFQAYASGQVEAGKRRGPTWRSAFTEGRSRSIPNSSMVHEWHLPYDYAERGRVAGQLAPAPNRPIDVPPDCPNTAA